jgi:DNA-binding NtrC family response regulator
MATVNRLLELVAKSDLSVLLLGETGVGKTVAAQRIHDGSARRSGPFVKINCAALPEALLESELFGYERGAFSGAAQAKLGLLESASGGTLLLDEIGEMPLATQAKLLSAIENREITPLGSIKPRRIDVRFVAATNRDLPRLVANGGFRQDLYFRLEGMSVSLPPLRARRAEIPEIAQQLLERACAESQRPVPSIAASALKELCDRGWPGNLRELKNAIERALVLSEGGPLLPSHFPSSATAPAVGPAEDASEAPPPSRRPRAQREVGRVEGGLHDEMLALERQRVIDALEKCGGNQTHAAKMLGISRRALIHRIEAHDLPRPRKRGEV